MVIFLFFGIKFNFAQTSDFKYFKTSYIMVPKTDSFYDVGEYTKSINFNLSQVDSTGKIINPHNYVLAQDYALLGNQDSAFYFLNKYVDGVPRDYRSIYVDQDFEPLKADEKRWNEIINKVEAIYITELDSTMNKELALRLFRMYPEIQKYGALSSVSFRRSEMPSSKEIAEVGIKYKSELKKIINKYGFPTPSKVGHTAADVAFYILHHSNIEDKYYRMVKDAYENGDYFPEHYALLTDRWLSQNGKKQLYGTQFRAQKRPDGKMGDYTLQPVDDFKNLNKRRAELGLPPIEDYAVQVKGTIPEEYYKE